MFILLIVKALSSAIIELEQENEELRLTNEILHKQLKDLGKFSNIQLLVEEDYEYNKVKLKALLEEFDESLSHSIKLSLCEQVLYYLEVLNLDLQILNSPPDPIESESLSSFTSSLRQQIENLQTAQVNQEFKQAYSSLRLSISQKDESIKSLQLENAKLLGNLDSSHSELEKLTQRLDHENSKLENLIKSLESTKSGQTDRLETLKNSLSNEENLSKSKEISDFQKIQKNQDELILKLQTSNTQQNLKIEELEMQKVNLLAKIRGLNNSILRLENEIQTRDLQVLESQKKFEEFRRDVELETNNEIISLRREEE
jgi:hypothetical protein